MLTPIPGDRLPASSQAAISLWYVAQRAGLSERTEAFVLNWVRQMHANEGFPPPLPYVQLSNGKRRDHIHLRSRWLRAAVDAWFGRFLPPELITVAEGIEAQAAAAILDARAGQLAGAIGAAPSLSAPAQEQVHA